MSIEEMRRLDALKTYKELQEAKQRIQQLEDAARVMVEHIKNMAEIHSRRAIEDIAKERKRATELEDAIRKTLDENRHLADGEDCTLRELKKALPTWN